MLVQAMFVFHNNRHRDAGQTNNVQQKLGQSHCNEIPTNTNEIEIRINQCCQVFFRVWVQLTTYDVQQNKVLADRSSATVDSQ